MVPLAFLGILARLVAHAKHHVRQPLTPWPCHMAAQLYLSVLHHFLTAKALLTLLNLVLLELNGFLSYTLKNQEI